MKPLDIDAGFEKIAHVEHEVKNASRSGDLIRDACAVLAGLACGLELLHHRPIYLAVSAIALIIAVRTEVWKRKEKQISRKLQRQKRELIVIENSAQEILYEREEVNVAGEAILLAKVRTPHPWEN